MPSTELITIGTEILLGDIQDTNSRFLARQLRDIGVDLFRTTTIGDNASRIANAVREALTRVDIVITTGGLGPTVDDPTREAIALAFSTTNEFHPELWSTIENRFLKRGIIPTENNKRQAYVPAGAQVIANPVGTAPAFYYPFEDKIVICLPGVPKEMEFLTSESVLPLIKQKFDLQAFIKVRVLHLSGVGESAVDQPIAEFERMTNPTVGLLAFPGKVDIRITAKAANESMADEMISRIEPQLAAKFPDDIFGFDEQTLAGCVSLLANHNHLTIEIRGYGLGDIWPTELSENKEIRLLPELSPIDLQNHKKDQTNRATLHFLYNYRETNGECCLDYSVFYKGNQQTSSMLYTGPQAQGPLWAINRAMDIIRRQISNSIM